MKLKYLKKYRKNFYIMKKCSDIIRLSKPKAEKEVIDIFKYELEELDLIININSLRFLDNHGNRILIECDDIIPFEFLYHICKKYDFDLLLYDAKNAILVLKEV